MTLKCLLIISVLSIIAAATASYFTSIYIDQRNMEEAICLEKGFDAYHSTTTGLKKHKKDVIIRCKNIDNN